MNMDWPVVLFVLAVACEDRDPASVVASRAELAPAPATAPTRDAGGHAPEVAAELEAWGKKPVTTYAEAIDLYKPLMADSSGTPSDGAKLFAVWSADHLRLPDVLVAKNETSVGRVKKDSSTEIGKRMCLGGRIVQIFRDRSVDAQLHCGTLMTDRFEVIHYYAVRSTGDLVEHSRARLCGVVTGALEYKNVSGGTTQAIQMVGIFVERARR